MAYAGPTHAAVTAGATSGGTITNFSLTSIRGVGRRMFLGVMTANQAMAAPSGWTAFTADSGTPSRGSAGVAGGVRIIVFWKDSDNTETTVNFADSGDIQYVVGYSVDKASGATGIAFGESIADNAAASTSGSFSCPTTSDGNCFVISFVATDRDANGASWSGQANADLANVSERFDNGTATNSGGGVMIVTGEKEVAGTIGNTAATQASSAAFAWITVALKNVSGGGGGDVLFTTSAIMGLASSVALARDTAFGTAATVTVASAASVAADRGFATNGAVAIGSAASIRKDVSFSATGALLLGSAVTIAKDVSFSATGALAVSSAAAQSVDRGFGTAASFSLASSASPAVDRSFSVTASLALASSAALTVEGSGVGADIFFASVSGLAVASSVKMRGGGIYFGRKSEAEIFFGTRGPEDIWLGSRPYF